YTLFATHYFEITSLPETVPGIANVHLNATEHKDNIVFLHKVQEGPASKSYGLQVAKLAGIPASVLAQAQHQLQLLEQGEQTQIIHNNTSASSSDQDGNSSSPAPLQTGLFDVMPNPVVEALKKINPDNFSPREALEQLYRLKEVLNKGK